MTQTDPPPEGASREDLFRATLSQLVDGIVVLDRDGRLQMLNAAAEEVLGVNVHGIPHDQWPAHFGIYRPDGVTLCPVEELPLLRALKGEEVRDAEYVLRNAARPAARCGTVRARSSGASACFATSPRGGATRTTAPGGWRRCSC